MRFASVRSASVLFVSLIVSAYDVSVDATVHFAAVEQVECQALVGDNFVSGWSGEQAAWDGDGPRVLADGPGFRVEAYGCRLSRLGTSAAAAAFHVGSHTFELIGGALLVNGSEAPLAGLNRGGEHVFDDGTRVVARAGLVEVHVTHIPPGHAVGVGVRASLRGAKLHATQRHWFDLHIFAPATLANGGLCSTDPEYAAQPGSQPGSQPDSLRPDSQPGSAPGSAAQPGSQPGLGPRLFTPDSVYLTELIDSCAAASAAAEEAEEAAAASEAAEEAEQAAAAEEAEQAAAAAVAAAAAAAAVAAQTSTLADSPDLRVQALEIQGFSPELPGLSALASGTSSESSAAPDTPRLSDLQEMPAPGASAVGEPLESAIATPPEKRVLLLDGLLFGSLAAGTGATAFTAFASTAVEGFATVLAIAMCIVQLHRRRCSLKPTRCGDGYVAGYADAEPLSPVFSPRRMRGFSNFASSAEATPYNCPVSTMIAAS